MTTSSRSGPCAGLTAVVALTLLAGCGGDGPRVHGPTAPRNPPPPPVASVASQLVGSWGGSTNVTAREGVEPGCLPPFLEHGFADSLAAEIFTQGVAPVLLQLEQEAIGGSCYFTLSSAGTSLSASPYGSSAWGYDSCQVELDSSAWGCSPPAPELRVIDVGFRGTFTDAPAARITGVLELRYEHDGREGTPSGRFAVTEEFELTQVAK